MARKLTEVFQHVVKIKSVTDNPIGIDLWYQSTPEKQFVTTAAISYSINGNTRWVDAGYHFDGASVPRPLWWISGFSPLDRDTLLAACLHDALLDFSSMPRVMADAWFVSVLCGATLNGRSLPQCSQRRARLMYIAVRFWSILSGFLRARTGAAK